MKILNHYLFIIKTIPTQIKIDETTFKIASPKFPMCNRLAVSSENVLNVLNPPQKPITTRGCNQVVSTFLIIKNVKSATKKEAIKLEINVAIGN